MTTSYRTCLERSQHFLRRILRKPAWDFNRFVCDPRQAKGRRWKFPTLMRAVLWGFLTNRRRVRAVESVTECGVDQRIPDSTRSDCVGQFSGEDVADLRRQLHAHVRTDWPSQVPCTRGLALWGGGGGEQDAVDWTSSPRPRPPRPRGASAPATGLCPGPGGAHRVAVRGIPAGHRSGGDTRRPQ